MSPRTLLARFSRGFFIFALSLVCGSPLFLAAAIVQSSPGDASLARYFQNETTRVSRSVWSEINGRQEWENRKPELRRQLQEMLGLLPFPFRSELSPVIVGTFDHEDIVVERLHFQSMPNLYVTANLYRPKGSSGPFPAILYACGHAVMKTNGISLGNKTGYQHHGAWFARNGYVCLVIDTIQLGEIEGVHHGTYRDGKWWWNSKGYTPAGVEAWNCIRAIDYLETRPEVDPKRIGMTGRSGGGSYTWTTAALDERIRVAAPVAGITDMQNQVVDGCVEGHCDCMFFLNKYRWDFPINAALIAPRPLLIVNTDSDSIFPLDGVERLHARVRTVYDWYGAKTNLGLVIGPGPHMDTQDLQVPVFRWFNRFLKGENSPVRMTADKLFTPDRLRVLESKPPAEINSGIERIFGDRLLNSDLRMAGNFTVRGALLSESFRGWPDNVASANALELAATANSNGMTLQRFDFESQPYVPLSLFVLRKSQDQTIQKVHLTILDSMDWDRWARAASPQWAEAFRGTANVPGASVSENGPSADDGFSANIPVDGEIRMWFAPRGIGPSAWTGDERQQTQIRRRFMLLGQTLDGMRIWDIRRTIHAVRFLTKEAESPVTLHARRAMAVNVLYAALFEPTISRLQLDALPERLEDQPDYLNVLRVTNLDEVRSILTQAGVQW